MRYLARGAGPAQLSAVPPAPATPLDARAPAVRRTLGVILVLNLLVFAVKLVVGIRAGSLSVLGAALESALDGFNNVLGISLVRVAAREPDEDHPYGHEKFETLGALAIVGFLSISCFELLQRGVVQLVRGAEVPRPSTAELALLAATMVVNVFIVWYERRRGRELQSPFLIADATHTASDIYVTLLALGSLVLARVGVGGADAVLALAVALIIAWNGYRILRETIPTLVDERAVSADEIRRLLDVIPEVREVRAVRSRSGPSGYLYAELTVAVPAGMTVEAAHEVADRVEARIEEVLGSGHVTVHVEPV